jgi:hypothetical protein
MKFNRRNISSFDSRAAMPFTVAFVVVAAHPISLRVFKSNDYEFPMVNKLRGWRSLAMKINLNKNYETSEQAPREPGVSN